MPKSCAELALGGELWNTMHSCRQIENSRYPPLVSLEKFIGIYTNLHRVGFRYFCFAGDEISLWTSVVVTIRTFLGMKRGYCTIFPRNPLVRYSQSTPQPQKRSKPGCRKPAVPTLWVKISRILSGGILICGLPDAFLIDFMVEKDQNIACRHYLTLTKIYCCPPHA